MEINKEKENNPPETEKQNQQDFVVYNKRRISNVK